MPGVTAKTFLQLCQSLRQESGISGTGPLAVTNQTGQLQLIVDWVAQAYIDIQNRHNSEWRWMRRTFTLETVADDGVYVFGDCTDIIDAAFINRFKRWRFQDLQDPPKVYLSSSGVNGESYLSFVPWDIFKQIYKTGSQTASQPAHISIDPNNNLVLGPVPNDVDVITGDYVMGAMELAADDDTPDMPADYHKLIVGYAMEEYAYRYVAQEALYRAAANKKRQLRQLEGDQLATIQMAGPMA